jgi:hypothetical protein
MASITYKYLSALQPIELKYQYYKDEELNNTKISYTNGYTFYKYDSLLNYQDTTNNKESTFILTSAIPLQKVFNPQTQYKYGELPGTILLQPRSTNIYYAAYKPETGTITLSLTGSSFYISPIEGTNQVEILVNNKYLQVDSRYPYLVRANTRSVVQAEINRQRFECIYQNSTITFKTKTQDGDRYLAFNNDNTLRATGVLFNNTVINDYIFKCLPVTSGLLTVNFNPENKWLTYYYNILQEQENKTLNIKKEFLVPTNFLIDFPSERAVKTGQAYVNIANLKTCITPLGSPAPIDNI